MNQSSDQRLALACVASRASAAATLQEAVLTLFPGAAVHVVDTSVERGLPEGIDCAVIDAADGDGSGTDVLRGVRARGYQGAAVLVVDSTRSVAAPDIADGDRLGGRYCSLDGESLAPLATAISDAIHVHPGANEAAPSIALKALRQTQRMIAAGELATRLQHSLNNPLAGLLAEAQLLELEPLPPDHRASVERIIELSRRVINVVRALDGVGRA
jgi:signal transduction histidine kinase